MFTVTKTYRDLPASHRQHGHTGRCRLIHGHNWQFDIRFGCRERDENKFVIDVGALKPVGQFFQDYFDHTLLLNHDDPDLKTYQADPNCKVMVVPDCSMEGLACLAHGIITRILHAEFRSSVEGRGLFVIDVVCWEDSKNQACFCP